jgi:mannose-6-phosphate isomerase-like protein (cupin superfamily)
MILGSSDQTAKDGKGWFVGPWNSPVPVAVGWADRGVNQPHRHEKMCEIYLVARGTSTALVADRSIELVAGDMLVVEPGEPHTFLTSSIDYLHFVVQAPFVKGDKVEPITRDRSQADRLRGELLGPRRYDALSLNEIVEVGRVLFATRTACPSTVGRRPCGTPKVCGCWAEPAWRRRPM